MTVAMPISVMPVAVMPIAVVPVHWRQIAFIGSREMPPGGAIGTACDVPETATISNPAAAIATTVRVIPFSLSFSSSANLGEHITRRHDGSSTAPAICKHEQAVRIVFDSPTTLANQSSWSGD
jgi:hypothetical protein